MNNILNIAVEWKPKDTRELIKKIYSVSELYFMDYRSALHDSGNYKLVKDEIPYHVSDALWRCKSATEKTELFQSFLKDSKKRQEEKFITSRDGKFAVVNKTKGTATKCSQRKYPFNERSKTRWLFKLSCEI